MISRHCFSVLSGACRCTTCHTARSSAAGALLYKRATPARSWGGQRRGALPPPTRGKGAGDDQREVARIEKHNLYADVTALCAAIRAFTKKTVQPSHHHSGRSCQVFTACTCWCANVHVTSELRQNGLVPNIGAVAAPARSADRRRGALPLTD